MLQSLATGLQISISLPLNFSLLLSLFLLSLLLYLPPFVLFLSLSLPDLFSCLCAPVCVCLCACVCMCVCCIHAKCTEVRGWHCLSCFLFYCLRQTLAEFRDRGFIEACCAACCRDLLVSVPQGLGLQGNTTMPGLLCGS